jgi:non-specific serine/threonine protein kinase/serine/threonine-protein kinase
MRSEVEALLAADSCSDSPLDAKVLSRGLAEDLFNARGDTSPDALVNSLEEDCIGPYSLVRPIGEGGMGVVYLAEQTEPLRRHVAVKIIKLGMDTRQVIGRFEIERQVLAMMDHANVARVIDAGSTAQGRPFFVMEYVDGPSLTTYAMQNKLTVRERLELFIQVCLGVQHAHQKGIIHRDLKPSNVLVTNQDGRPLPKVIDFGIAKATALELPGATMHTEHGQLMGTPEYMSPEQAGLSPHDVDTRTDVYALGAILYELLTGHRPFDTDSLRQAPFHEIQRIIREQDPPRPSTRASYQSSDDAPQTAHRELRGDLDWITMKALDKDRTRRYTSAAALAADITRHLNDEPVIAAAPTCSYRMRKYVRRNRSAVIGASGTVIALFVGLIVAAWSAFDAMHARDVASREAATAQAINAFITDALLSADPRDGAIDVRVVDVLDNAVTTLADHFTEQKEVEAQLCMTLGRVYCGLGKYDKALPVYDRMLELRRQLYEPDNPLIGGALSNLAVCHNLIGNAASAVDLGEEAYSILKDAPQEQGNALKTLHNLTMSHLSLGHLERAERFARSSVDRHKAHFGEQHPHSAIALSSLGRVLVAGERYAEAERVLIESADIIRAALGEDHVHLATALSDLGHLYHDMGEHAQAAGMFTDALNIQEKVLGRDHAYTTATMSGLGLQQLKSGEHAAGVAILLEAVAIIRSQDGNEDQLARTLQILAKAWLESDEFHKAEGAMAEVLALRQGLMPEDAPDVVEAQALLESIRTAHAAHEAPE